MLFIIQKYMFCPGNIEKWTIIIDAKNDDYIKNISKQVKIFIFNNNVKFLEFIFDFRRI